MLGHSAFAKNSDIDDRIFIYEVEGLNQISLVYQTQITIRNSGKTLLPIPFSRMGSFMQQINRLGGKIVSIRPSNYPVSASVSSEQESED